MSVGKTKLHLVSPKSHGVVFAQYPKGTPIAGTSNYQGGGEQGLHVDASRGRIGPALLGPDTQLPEELGRRIDQELGLVAQAMAEYNKMCEAKGIPQDVKSMQAYIHKRVREELITAALENFREHKARIGS